MSDFVYIAHPIDFGTCDELTEGLTVAKSSLAGNNVATFDPGLPYSEPMAAVDAVYAINETALEQANGVLALLPAGLPTVGTPMEIQAARERGIPVVVAGAKTSLQLQAMGIPRYSSDRDGVVHAVEWLLGQLRNRPPGRKLKYTGQTDCAPQRFHDGDAGFDLVCSENVAVRPGEFKDIDCGIRIELPEGSWAMITGRSSTLRKRHLMVAQGVIDNGYRGRIYAGVWNLGEKIERVKRGERIAQLIPYPLTAAAMRPLQVGELTDSSRGEAGFGSTGHG